MSWKPDPHCQCNDENEVQCPRKGNRLWIVRHGPEQDKRYIPVCEFHYDMLRGRRASDA